MNDEATTQPADVGQLDRHVRPTLEESLGRYWDAAYAEGREGRAHDTENGEAQQALNDIMAAVAEMIDAAHAADVDILAEYSRQDGRREWVDVGTWLRPGEVVAHMDDPRPCEGLCFTHPKRATGEQAMQLEVKIDQEAVQQQVVQAIMNSAIGAQIQKAITEALTKTTGSFGDYRTLVERAVQDAVMQEVRNLANSLILEKREAIRAQLAEKLTDETIGSMTGVLWGKLEEAMRRA